MISNRIYHSINTPCSTHVIVCYDSEWDHEDMIMEQTLQPIAWKVLSSH